MYVCHCKAVTDRTINGLIAEGCTTVSEIRRMCGASSRCGSCRPFIESQLAEGTKPLSETRVALGAA